MNIDPPVKTPCIGVCSTGIGDQVCRGCKRFAHEIIYWNSYSNGERGSIQARLQNLTAQVAAGKLRVVNAALLRQKLMLLSVTFDDSADPHCWVVDLLKAGASQITDLEEFGCEPLAHWRDSTCVDIKDAIDKDLYVLSVAHHQRYFNNGAKT